MPKQTATAEQSEVQDVNALPEGATYSATQDRVFVLKKGTEVEEQYDGLKIPFVVAGYGRTDEEAMQNMLNLCGGDRHAVTDIFNSAFALACQKRVKEDTAVVVTKDKETKEETRTAPTATEADLRKIARDFVGERNQRRAAGTSQKEAKEKANLLDLLLRGEITLEEVQKRQRGES